jgi:hypothetical protein
MPRLDPFTNVTTALTKAHIIPDVLGSFSTPSAILSILPLGPFPSVQRSLFLRQLSRQASRSQARSEDDIGVDGIVENETRYTLAMFDPDAPSAAQPTSSQFRHWVVRSVPILDRERLKFLYIG